MRNAALDKAAYKGFTDLLVLFGDGKGWIKRVYAREHKRGVRVAATNPKATCWCLSGGLQKVVSSRAVRHRMRTCLNAALPKAHCWGFVGYNDDPKTKFPDIRRLVLRARRLIPRMAAVFMFALLAGCGSYVCDCGDGRKIEKQYGAIDTRDCALFCATEKCSTTTTTTLPGIVLHGTPYLDAHKRNLP